jgi:hypothetical protein
MKVTFISEACGAHGEPDHDHDLRCACGALLARLLLARVELRCRRCKRGVVIELGAPPGARSARAPA